MSAVALRGSTQQQGLKLTILTPLARAGPTLMKLHSEYLPKNGYIENGKHHEIYLSDPRKVAAEKLRTVLRQPVQEI